MAAVVDAVEEGKGADGSTPDGTSAAQPHYWHALDDTEAWTTFLDREGYVVLKHAASQDDVDSAKDKLWSDIEGAHPGVQRDDTSTWLQANWRLPIAGLVAELAQVGGGVGGGADLACVPPPPPPPPPQPTP